jgi:molybdopterin converting factor small subunit
MEIRLKLFPPLSDAAGASELNLTVGNQATLMTVVDGLVKRFGSTMKRHFFDTEGRIIPSWAVFLNQKIVPFNQPQVLEVPVQPQDEVSFILNIAGG